MKYKSYLDALNQKEKLEEDRSQQLIEINKCYGCTWGKWTGIKYYCMMPRCIKRKAGGW